MAYSFELASSTEDSQEHEKWRELAAALEEINTFQLHMQGKLVIDPWITDVEVPTAWEGISLSYEADKATQKEVLQLSMALQIQRKAVNEVVAKMELLTISSSSINQNDLQKVANACAS